MMMNVRSIRIAIVQILRARIHQDHTFAAVTRVLNIAFLQMEDFTVGVKCLTYYSITVTPLPYSVLCLAECIAHSDLLDADTEAIY